MRKKKFYQLQYINILLKNIVYWKIFELKHVYNMVDWLNMPWDALFDS